MTQSYTPNQIANAILAGEFTRESEFVTVEERDRLRLALHTIRDLARKALEDKR